jgi:hypothetical protein
MGYVLAAYQPAGASGGTQIPRQVGPSGFMDIGSGHSTSRPSRAGAGIVHHPLISLPNGYVYDPIVGQTAIRADMDISANCILLAANGVTNNSAQLDTWLGFLGTTGILSRMRDSDGAVHIATARLVIVDANRSYQMRRYLPIQLTWTLTGLPWSGIVLEQSGAAFSASGTQTWTATNLGNVPQFSSSVNIPVPSGSTLTEIQFYNNTTGQSWTWTGSLVGGTNVRLFIDHGAMRVIQGVIGSETDAYAGFTPPTNTEDWLRVNPGTNAMQANVIMTGPGLISPFFSYFDAWA